MEEPLVGSEGRTVSLTAPVDDCGPMFFVEQFVIHDEVDDMIRHCRIIQRDRDHDRIPRRLVMPELPQGEGAIPDDFRFGHRSAEV